FKEIVQEHWRYIVVSLALLVSVTILSQSVSASLGASTIQAAVPTNPANHTLAGYPKEIATTLMGDANNDNVVDGIDFSIVKAYFGQTCGGDPLCARADLDHNGVVNLEDWHVLEVNFNF